MYYVYELINLMGGVDYVGHSDNPSHRMKQHLSKPNSNQTGHGKFYRRQDIFMHIVSSFKTKKEALQEEYKLQVYWGLTTDRSKWGNRKKISTNKGGKNKMAKINEEDVRRIKILFNKGFSDSEIALMFNVSRPNINLIRNNKAWTHVK